ncbi:PrsW family intramembrane metalloprotease [Hallella mizrahii]|uniref:PrsW family intramembrane metalloprotease n=1 Tax=Hallella mizrahii TaxID=2606637 RepID=A0A7K0KGP6_9BACT|nr:PrsW family glutamic-type intramembrane protease [Hallella mizrahii]MST85062.1 PrsW family intramembrane metalloprotease [Hallella mizrahii]
MIYIIRNQHEYGPYEASDIARYVEEGRLLLNDRARDAESDVEGTVEELLAARGIRPRVRNRGSLMEQLRYIGHAFIFPKDDMERHHIMEDKRLLILAIVGLSLSIIMLLPIGGYLVFYAVSLYFATIWGLFFAYFFRTRQISKSKAVSTFFLTQLGVFVIFSGLNELNFFYAFTSAPFPLSILGYILGIGLTEEFAKMIPLLVLERRAREPQLPQTMVFYGLMAGIAFGVFEGVQYQTSINIRADYTTAFVLNIARLTSLPFLHAVWAGICGYFVGMAGLYPQYRKSLYVLALAIPATLHGLYDLFAGSFYLVSLVIAFLSVFLLMAYLRRSNALRERLRG